MTERTDAVFAALSDPTRREVMRSLSESGPSTATALTARIPVTRQAIAKHLAALEDAGLVTCTRSGREKLYRLSPAPLADAMDWMTQVGAQWDERLASLRRHIAATKRR